MIEVSSVDLRVGGRTLLSDFSWQLPDPGVFLLLGSTASGKTTIARLLTGRLKPQRGRVLIDGEPVYYLLQRYHNPLFYADAGELCDDADSLEDYLFAEIANAGGHRKALDAYWDILAAEITNCRKQSVCHLSHGQVLLAQVALACAIPVRVAVLDGHLTYLDRKYCAAVGHLLAVEQAHREKYIIFTATRSADFLPDVDGRFLLNGELPSQISMLDDASVMDTAVELQESTDALRVTFEHIVVNVAGVTSGKHFSILALLEDGLLMKPTGSLDAALDELRARGYVIKSLKWQRP